jgi:hypothetical protein
MKLFAERVCKVFIIAVKLFVNLCGAGAVIFHDFAGNIHLRGGSSSCKNILADFFQRSRCFVYPLQLFGLK